MNCPDCQQNLPYHFAIMAGKQKMHCPYCSIAISPTKKSFDNISRVSGIIAFIVGVLLSVICSYIWMILEQPFVSVLVYLLGIAGVLGSSIIYSSSHIEFESRQ